MTQIPNSEKDLYKRQLLAQGAVFRSRLIQSVQRGDVVMSAATLASTLLQSRGGGPLATLARLAIPRLLFGKAPWLSAALPLAGRLAMRHPTVAMGVAAAGVAGAVWQRVRAARQARAAQAQDREPSDSE